MAANTPRAARLQAAQVALADQGQQRLAQEEGHQGHLLARAGLAGLVIHNLRLAAVADGVERVQTMPPAEQPAVLEVEV